MSQKSYDGTNSLYLIPTPIGNLEDITLRAINTLKKVDLVFCEDTRIAGLLLNKLEIKKKLVSCNNINEENVKEKALLALKEGLNIGLVTDRGTPIISDPGYKLVEYVVNNGYNVIGLPGPTALIPALITSGIEPSPFLFYGFLNSKQSKLEKELDMLKSLKYTLIFYESPHRIISMLESLRKVFGDRRISVNREISKLYEEIYRGTITEVINELGEEIKGEFVIIVEGNKDVIDYNEVSVREHIISYVNLGYSEKEAMKLVARDRNTTKSDVYKEYHKGSD
ncbi:MAG: 16S rRNA (cytidine(1402)-2'-O)-methyltransferase [Bacilli bacterium]|nr:16S rRNA (cytidine(1402)-2'-O)-methyltransferase [Bacilli bacterium]